MADEPSAASVNAGSRSRRLAALEGVARGSCNGIRSASLCTYR